MKIPGAVYYGKAKRRYLAVYNYQHDISVMLPPGFESAERLAHFSYSKGGRKGGVDVFSLPENLDPSPIIKQKKSFYLRDNSVYIDEARKQRTLPVNTGHVKRKYDVQAELVARGPVSGEVLRITLGDIVDFCKDEFATNQRGSRIQEVDRIIPVTEVKFVEPERVLTGGKQWFYPDCILEANIDRGKGCVTTWIPGENASFDGRFFTNFFSFLWGECEYCYAQKRHESFPKTIYEFDRQRLREELNGKARLEYGTNKELGRPVSILRFGKRTEIWTPWTKDSFVATLEEMTESGTRGVVPTKFLEFNPEVAELLKRTHSTVLFSIGMDEYELGAVQLGRGNAFRIEQAIKYREAGVNSALYLHIVGIPGPGERELQILEQAGYGKKIPIQILPFRFNRKAQAIKIAGESWEFLKGGDKKHGQGTLPMGNFGSYVYHNGELVPQKLHEYWLGLIGNNNGRIRMCHHDEHKLYCGGCFQKAGIIAKHRNKELSA